MPQSCEYAGNSYSDGAVICQNGTEYRCNDGSWEILGTPCDEIAVPADPEAQSE